MSDQITRTGFSVNGTKAHPVSGSSFNSFEACPNDLDDDGGPMYISLTVNGLGAFTPVEVRVIAARLIELAKMVEAA